ncbi:MAG TPA: formate C-acetyltransferase/glycerol dehydratase family glycyl radical enzyme [bacterium]|nr:formate C-acetyltransferase/glycerol dehydratase family glycyl radical enzyme [bacterium]
MKVFFPQDRHDLDSFSRSERITAMKKLIMDEPRFASVEQAKIITETYKSHEEEPRIVKRALSLAASLREIAIRIDPGEIIVGNRTSGIRAGVIFPEAGLSWLEKEIDTLDSREQDRFHINGEDIEYFREILAPYWSGNSLEDGVREKIGTDIGHMAKVVKINQKDHAQGHIIPNTEKWLKFGPAGLLEEVRKRIAVSEDKERDFLRSVEIVLEGAKDFIRRYGDLARSLPDRPDYGRFTRDLRETGRICKKLADGGAESFHEAVQSLWFLFVILHLESNASSFSPGRLDQYLYPYFMESLQTGDMNLERALEIIESLWLNFNKIVYLRNSLGARYFAGFPIGFNIALGGKNKNGTDSANLLSYICLRAQEHLGLPQPNLSVRLHRNSPDWFIDKSSQVIGKGSGMPQVFNDESVIPALMNQGIAETDAFNYGIVGCVELSSQGNSLGWSDAAMFNLVKALELTLNNGSCLITGDTIGLSSGYLTDYKTFEVFLTAFKKQITFFVEKMISACDFVDRYHAELMPSPFLSAVIDNCIEDGLDVTAGGAFYNLSGIQAIQVANVADSLAVLKDAVFATGAISAAELLRALQTNWRGDEKLRQKVINHVPKYGNDVAWVDELGAEIIHYFAELIARYTNARGGKYHTGLYTVSAHVPMGKNVGASPDGRLSKSPLADGGVSAMCGRDEQGPTALLKSVDRLDARYGSNGSLLNMKFLPEFFHRKTDRLKFNALLKSFCEMRINHVQFNVVRKEDLLHAQRDPEAYRGLTIRVAGYTAYFTDLAADLQDEIIERTSYGG